MFEDKKRRFVGARQKKADPVKVLLPVALAAAVVLGASVWLGAAAWAGREAVSAPEPGGVDVRVRVPDPEPQETVGPQDPVPEVEVIAAVVNESDNPEEEVPEEPVAEPEPQEVKPLIVFSQEALDERIGKIVGSIITDGMTKREQAYAIFQYVNSHVRYVGAVQKSSWQEGAFEGLTTGRGDCYTYYALSRALLTTVGIDNLEVQRVGGKDEHYWNLVDCGDGWYHFDASPHSVPMPVGSSFFMFTDAQAAAYTELAGRNYYDFDGSLYPERAVGPETEEEPEVPTEPEILPEQDEPFEEPELPAEDPAESLPPEAEIAAAPEEEPGEETPDETEPPAETDGPDEPDDLDAPGDEEPSEEPDESAGIADDVPEETELPGETDDVSEILLSRKKLGKQGELW